MTSPAILSRMASKTMIPNGEGFGGFAALSQTDVAHGLVGLPGGPAALMRAMYGGDTSDLNMRALYIWSWQSAVDLAIQHGWNVPKGRETYKTLAARACDELVYPRLTHCPHCNGAGKVHPNGHNPEGSCRLCNETGKRSICDDEMAALIGVTVDEWQRTWAMRYMRIFARLLEWHSQGCANVNRRLSSE